MDKLTKLKDLSFIIIPFFIMNGFLYHLAYWGDFGLNGLSYISFSDVLKSSIYPIVSTSFLNFLLLLITLSFGFVMARKRVKKGTFSNNPREELMSDPNLSLQTKKDMINARQIGFMIGWLIMLFSLVLNYSKTGSLIYIPLVIATIGPLSMVYSQLVCLYIPNILLRLLILFFVPYLPLTSLFSGIQNADDIKNNISYDYIINLTKQKADTLKLLGITEKYFIFSDFKNTQIMMIKADKIDTLIIHKFQKLPN